MNIFDSENTKMLVSALLSIKDERQCRDFLEDLMNLSKHQKVLLF